MQQKFLSGIKEGLATLWQPWFLTGARNGGFEQTLKVVCLPEIEKATGTIAFTESQGRVDAALIRESETIALVEFKINFAQQGRFPKPNPDEKPRGEIERQKLDAIEKLFRENKGGALHRFYVHAVVELIHDGVEKPAFLTIHNEKVKLPAYKKFYSEAESAAWMAKVREVLGEREVQLKSDVICDEERGMKARLHVWAFEAKSPDDLVPL